MTEQVFGRFSQRARQVLQFASEEARALNHSYLGTEHILLGLIRELDGIAARVLDDLEVTILRSREAVEFIIGKSEEPAQTDQELSTRGKQLIAYAADEADRLNHHSIDTEHLLLGLVRTGQSVAAAVLDIQGVQLAKVHAQVMQILRNEGETP